MQPSQSDSKSINIILATDCGSTTSKARFFKKIGEEYRFVASGEAPTTVEAPYEDVTVGVRNAIREIEELTGHKLLSVNGVIIPRESGNEGVDLYVTTSSAGGGLQMMVSGVAKDITAESAERAALGAGAIVMDVLAQNDGREPYEKIERIRFLRPDMLLVSGGTDGGAVDPIVRMAEYIAAANPHPRLGISFKMPVVYAGNKRVSQQFKSILGEGYAFKIVDNLRPILEVENTEPARNAVHEFFMEHVMSHAPGYDKLMKWTPIPIMPTPAGEGTMFRVLAETRNENVIGVGLGGATTNVYSVYDGKFVRTVSANLGMSYSICNVLKEAGFKNIARWIPFDVNESQIKNSLANKMIYPTTIPQTLKDLMIEHAVAREALRLGFQHHKELARPLLGIQRIDDLTTMVLSEAHGLTYIDMKNIQWLGGTGGLLSHAPNRAQSSMILIDSFQPEGVTRLVQDSVFMMPHLGVLSTVHPKAAIEIFDKDCIVRLGTCITFSGKSNNGDKIGEINLDLPEGNTIVKDVIFGEIERIKLDAGASAKATIKPTKGFDVGAGPGHMMNTTIEGGIVGIIIDSRGRPLLLPEDKDERQKTIIKWHTSMGTYEMLSAL